MTQESTKKLFFTEQECTFIKEMTRDNLVKLMKTKDDLVKDKNEGNKEMDISGAMKFTDFVSASMEWLMGDPNRIFGDVEDKNAFIVITLLRDVEELDNGKDGDLKMSIMEKVAERLQQEPRLKPHMPF